MSDFPYFRTAVKFSPDSLSSPVRDIWHKYYTRHKYKIRIDKTAIIPEDQSGARKQDLQQQITAILPDD